MVIYQMKNEIAKSISVTSLLDENSNIDKENQGMIDTIVAKYKTY